MSCFQSIRRAYLHIKFSRVHTRISLCILYCKTRRVILFCGRLFPAVDGCQLDLAAVRRKDVHIKSPNYFYLQTLLQLHYCTATL